MDFIHRLNPFHGKSSSRRSNDTSRLSTSIEDPTADHFASHFDNERTRPPSRTVYTPAPPPTPGKHRTPSILRSLAHHPSLSALKSKSSRRRSKAQPPLPQLPQPLFKTPQATSSPSGYQQLQNHTDAPTPHVPGHYSGKSFKRKNTLKKPALKNSKSVPDDLGSDGHHSPIREFEFEESFDQALSPTPHRAKLSSSPSKRKPVPRVSSDILAAPEIGNESLRVKMRVDVEFESPSRRRHSRTSSRDGGQSHRIPTRHHQSSPTKATINSQTRPKRLSLPYTDFTVSTIQHPHPPPLGSETQSLFRFEDFEPISDSGEADDGLDILVAQEDVPSGTPGGKMADLRRGVLLDGSRSEKGGATRFFSRDMYVTQPVSFTPTPTSSPSPKRHHASSPPSTTPSLTLDARRSASPFEVRLSPMVTKRMSLDAFGTPSPAEREDSWEREELDDHPEAVIEEGEDEANFEVTQLSTIKESPSSNRRSEDRSSLSLLPSFSVNKTPHSPSPRSGSDFQQTTRLVCSKHRRHVSAPPEDIARALSQAQEEYTKALQNEVESGRGVIEALKSEMEKLSKEQRARDEVFEAERGRSEALTEQNYELRTAEESPVALEDMKRAYAENEEFVQTLQIAHDNIAARCSTVELEKCEIEREKAGLVFERLEDAKTLISAEDQNKALQKEIDLLRGWCNDLSESKKIIEEEAVDLRNQLAEHEGTSKRLQLKLSQREAYITELQDKVGTKGYEMDEVVVENEGLKVQVQEVLAEMEILKENKKEWDDERLAMLERMERYQNDEEDSSMRNEDVSRGFMESQDLVQALTIDLERAQSSLERQTTIVTSQTQDIIHLRSEINNLEEKLSNTSDLTSRQLRDTERIRDRLLSENTDLKAQLQTSESALKLAIITSETTRATSEDAKSRLSSYLNEIDRLKLVEANLRVEIIEVRQRSADEELERMELGKRIKGLESDREMLNIALESKQLELALHQRKAGMGDGLITPIRGGGDGRMAASTSRLSGGRQGRATGDEMTPIPKRQLSQSTHALTSRSVRRETSIHSSSNSNASRNNNKSRPSSMMNPPTLALSSTTKHNHASRPQSQSQSYTPSETPKSPKHIKKSASNSSISSIVSGSEGERASSHKIHAGGLNRRSSLPVLKARLGVRPVSSVGSVVEEDEVSMGV